MFQFMNPPDYLRLQLRLEGKEIIGDNLLRQVEVVPDEEVPLLLIAQLADENLAAYFDEALPTELRKVVSAWAASLISTGKIPFYSHKTQNIASANLAKRLRLHPIFE